MEPGLKLAPEPVEAHADGIVPLGVNTTMRRLGNFAVCARAPRTSLSSGSARAAPVAPRRNVRRDSSFFVSCFVDGFADGFVDGFADLTGHLPGRAGSGRRR